MLQMQLGASVGYAGNVEQVVEEPCENLSLTPNYAACLVELRHPGRVEFFARIEHRQGIHDHPNRIS